jgi:hypothetical protein
MSSGLRKYSEASAIAWEMTKNLFGAVGGGMSDRFGMWREGFENNAGKMQQFGTNLGDAITAGMAIVGKLGTMFFDNLDTINSFLRFLADKVFPAIESFGGVFLGAFLAALPVIEVIVGMLLPVISALTSVMGMASGVPGLGGVGAIGTGMVATKMGRKALGIGAGRTMATGGIAKAGQAVGYGKFGLMSTGMRAAPQLGALGAATGNSVAGTMALGAGVMAVGAGGAYMMNRAANSDTATGGALQGVAGGAMLGGAIGSVVPVIGTAVGAVIGGVAGGLVGFFKGRGEQKRLKQAGTDLGKELIDSAIAGFADQTPLQMDQTRNRLKALAGDEEALDKLAKERNVSQETLTASLNVEISRLARAIETQKNVLESDATREKHKEFKDYTTTGMIQMYMEDIMHEAQMKSVTGVAAAEFEKGENTKAAQRSLFQFLEDGGDIKSGPGAKLAQAAISEIKQEGINRGLRGTELGDFVARAGSGMSAAAAAGGWNIDSGQMDIYSKDLQTIGGAPRAEFESSPLWNSIKAMGEMAGMKDLDKMLETAFNAGDPDMAIASISAQVYSDAATQIVALRDAGQLAAEELNHLVSVLTGGELKTGEDVTNARKTWEDRQNAERIRTKMDEGAYVGYDEWGASQ